MEKLREFQVRECKLEDLQRLCKWLGIHPSTDGKRQSLINWLIYEGYVHPTYTGGWSGMY